MKTATPVPWCNSLILLLFVATVPVYAHHSVAMYDQKGTVTVIGTVTKFQWTNPHAYLELDGSDANGEIKHYSILWDEITIMDPVYLTQPWKFAYAYKRMPGYKMQEYTCEANREYVDEQGFQQIRVAE